MLLPFPITGQFIKRTVVTATGTFTTQPDTRKMLVILQAGGGGGGGADAAAVGTGNVGGGGSAGGYLEAMISVDAFTGYAVTVGAAGAAGVSTGGNGGVGGDSTIVVGPTTYTAKGGLGGIGDAADRAVAGFTLGGASPAVASNGDVNSGGAPGGRAHLVAVGVIGISGIGGSTIFGAGGISRTGNGAGVLGIGFGSGGSGGVAQSGSIAVAGAAGRIGVIVIEEYA